MRSERGAKNVKRKVIWGNQSINEFLVGQTRLKGRFCNKINLGQGFQVVVRGGERWKLLIRYKCRFIP